MKSIVDNRLMKTLFVGGAMMVHRFVVGKGLEGTSYHKDDFISVGEVTRRVANDLNEWLDEVYEGIAEREVQYWIDCDLVEMRWVWHMQPLRVIVDAEIVAKFNELREVLA